MRDMEEVIRKLAYELWQQAGRPDGRSDEFWFAARFESECREERGEATRMLEGCGRAPVPVGGTPPGVVIVGSGNTQAAAPRVVGASW